MKAAILQYDHVMEKFMHHFGDYPEMVKQMFNRTDVPLSFDTFNCREGQFPTDINKYDFYITTGSKTSVYEELEWVEKSIHFIQLLDKHKKKLIGICFGHQLMAMACGGMVERSEKGWGVGIARNRVIANPKWMNKKISKIDILVSHQDQITEIPDDSLLIAENDFCPFFIVQWNSHFLSIQGHPEWNRDYSRTLMNERRAILPKATIDAGLDSLEIKPENAIFVNWILDFVRDS
jgi:GMP synthase-like glutamine amidotransferase